MSKSLQAPYNKTEIDKLQSGESRQWWRSIKNIGGIASNDNSIVTLADRVTNSDIGQLANMANDYFISVSDGLSRLEPLQVAQDFQVPDRYIISVEDVRAALHKVNLTKSIGPDYLPNWVLKDFADSLSQPVASVFNASLCQSTVPTIWKSADIVPLPKTRPPRIVEKDLRPISLTPVLAKILEGFVCGWLEKFSPDHEDKGLKA